MLVCQEDPGFAIDHSHPLLAPLASWERPPSRSFAIGLATLFEGTRRLASEIRHQDSEAHPLACLEFLQQRLCRPDAPPLELRLENRACHRSFATSQQGCQSPWTQQRVEEF